MLSNTVDALTGKSNGSRVVKIQGTVALMKKNVLDFNDFNASFLDGIHELFGKGISFQLISADQVDPGNGNRGRLGEAAKLKEWVSNLSIVAGDSKFKITFEWEQSLGYPGAFTVKNSHHSEFFLNSLTL